MTVVGFVACNNSSESSTPAADTTAVKADTTAVKVDTTAVKVDTTTKADTAAKK